MPRTTDGMVRRAQQDLKEALPAGHPVEKEVSQLLAAMFGELGDADVALTNEQQRASLTVETHERLVEVLADWRRGIRVWAEVEDELKRAGIAKERQDADSGGPAT